MGKIKLNLVSGAVIEKPLVNAFASNNNSYVVLDNEMNGSMGLPIILVSKLENNRLTKIVDQNEWQMVKEYLKNIIAGGQLSFISINNEIAADDIYYTQLTLPIPSFEALKNAYKVEAQNTPVVESTPVQNVEPIPVPDNNSYNEPVSINSTPVMNINSAINSIESTPVVDINANVEAQTPINNEVVTPQPINTPLNTEPLNNDVFKEQKEAFMQACENMFDALVQKFEKELENRK